MERLFQALDQLDDLIGVLRYRWLAYRAGRPAVVSVRKSSPAGAAVPAPAPVVAAPAAPAAAVASPTRLR